RSRARESPIQSPARTSSTNSSSLAGAPAVCSRLDCLALRGTRGLAIRASRQPTGQRQRRPSTQQVVRLLIGQAPQRAQQGQEQEGLLAIDAGRPPGPVGSAGGELAVLVVCRCGRGPGWLVGKESSQVGLQGFSRFHGNAVLERIHGG